VVRPTLEDMAGGWVGGELVEGKVVVEVWGRRFEDCDAIKWMRCGAGLVPCFAREWMGLEHVKVGLGRHYRKGELLRFGIMIHLSGYTIEQNEHTVHETLPLLSQSRHSASGSLSSSCLA
jgi:hypothetical protein